MQWFGLYAGTQYEGQGKTFTGEVVYIPKPNKSIARDRDATNVSGFGYCNSTNEYKIVRMYSDYKGHKCRFLVHTIGDGRGWRSKASPVHISLRFPLGVYANGYLHWLFGCSIIILTSRTKVI